MGPRQATGASRSGLNISVEMTFTPWAGTGMIICSTIVGWLPSIPSMRGAECP